ncbi:FecR domain-containing protein [Chitinophaga qingshengii]|uniref:FecR domain-containing protein n=1 Tax=Chitinophaga qingshengii TaxID=1569794 RepID=A0ABR7TLV3_9BACT|nr:FecR domain-containing protein [Chitinophaga qingshengii]MBC9930960.1 FecR domain-containing protein [Chitinophaga qingshengii]
MTSTFSDEALYTLLCKYLLNEADAAERAWVDAWLQDDTGNATLLASLGKVLQTAADQAVTVPVETDRSWEQLYAKMNVTPVQAQAPVIPEPARKSGYIYTLLKVAAVLLIALGAGWWFMTGKKPAAVYAGPATTQLPDGSSVTLMADSKLELAKGYNNRNRTVSLNGVATFDVAGNAGNPFVVMLGRTEVKVLGTRFTVHYVPGQQAISVHVASGKVMVIDHDKADSVVLTQGMLLQHDNLRPVFRIASHVADMEKKSLAFHDTPLEEVLHTITEVYDVKVELENTALLKLTVNANFNNQSIEEVMTALGMLLNAQWEKTGDRQYKLK